LQGGANKRTPAPEKQVRNKINSEKKTKTKTATSPAWLITVLWSSSS
jgi:hypothetical protein